MLKNFKMFKKNLKCLKKWKFLHFEPIFSKGQFFYFLQKKINWEFISQIKAVKIMFENDLINISKKKLNKKS